MQTNMVLRNLGHQALDSAANICQLHQNVSAIVSDSQRELDCIDLSAYSLDVRNRRSTCTATTRS